ncbi:hypothetical protein [Streptomyces sp. NPDC048361]|uniref:hypothetical protein n=1 Tax=Streptomyces sp. NPDC048361 TaxID=3154720 RepID=UPI003418F648
MWIPRTGRFAPFFVGGIVLYLPMAGLVATLLAAAWAVHRFVELPLGRRLKNWLSGDLGALRRAPVAAREDVIPPPR